MKYLIIILAVLFSITLKAQQRFPNGFPTQTNLGWNKWGYAMSDSGLIVANRDTNWLAKYSATIVFRPANKKFYYFDSTNLRWNLLAGRLDTAYNGASVEGNGIILGGALDRATTINNAGHSFLLTGTSSNVLRTTNGSFQSNVASSPIAAQLAASNSSNNQFSEVNATAGIAYMVGGKNGVFYNEIHADSDRVYLATKSNTAPKRLILDTLGYMTLDAYPSLTQETDTTTYKPIGINSAGKTVPMAYWKGSGGGGAGLTSVGISMPSGFTVTNSPLVANGTIAISGAGTTLQYIRGNGTLATFDTTAIPNFYLKVRGLLTGTSPVTFNQTTGVIGINNANTSGTKGAASFTGAFSDNGSGLIDLLTLVSAGSCTGCNLNIDAKGRITGYSDGAGGATNNTNIGAGIRPVNVTSQEMRTLFAGFGTAIDTVSNANGVTWKADTTRSTGLPTYWYVDSSVAAGGGGGTVTNVSGTTNRITVTNPTTTPVIDIAATYVGQTSITTLGTIATGIWNGTAIGATFGGTGQTTVTTGDLLYGSATNTWSKLAGVATGNALISGGVATAPSWGKIGLTTHVSGILPVANGGTGTATPSLVAGTDISITGTWPNQTINATGGGSVTAGYGIGITGSAVRVDTTVIDARYKKRFNVVAFGADPDSNSTDDCPAIQSAINAAFAYGADRSTVYFPLGHYTVGCALQHSVNGVDPDAQIVLPLSRDTATRKPRITFEGEAEQNWSAELVTTTNKSRRGVIIESTILDTGYVFGSSFYNDGAFGGNINWTWWAFENIEIRVRTKTAGVEINNTMSGINSEAPRSVDFDHVKVTVQSSEGGMLEPSSWTIGVKLPHWNNNGNILINNLNVSGYYNGVIATEHMNATELITFSCHNGLYLPYAFHSGNIDQYTSEGCVNHVFVSNEGGPFTGGPLDLHIGTYNVEHYTVPAQWNTYSSDVAFADSSVSTRIFIDYAHMAESGEGKVSTFNTNGPNRVKFGFNGVSGISNFLIDYGGSYLMDHTASALVDNNIFKLGSTTQTGGFIFGSTGLFDYTSGPHLGARGNTYSAFANQRGIMFFAGGQVSSPVGNEGSLLFQTQNINRMIVGYTGAITAPYLTRSATASDSALVPNASTGLLEVRPIAGSSTPILQTVLNAGNTGDTVIITSSSGTRRDIVLFNENSGVDDLAVLNVGSPSGNTSPILNLRPSGTGFSGIQSQIGVYNSSDVANPEILQIRATGTQYIINSFQDASGVARAIKLQMDGTDAIGIAATTGVITFNASSNTYTFPSARAAAGQVLTDVSGTGALTWQTPASGATTIYTGDGTLSGDRTVTGSGNDLTFLSMFNFRINANTFLLAKASPGAVYTTALVGAPNHYEVGYTPVPGVYSKGAGLYIDTNNNVGLGTIPATTLPLYATGNSTTVSGLQSSTGNFYVIRNVTANATVSINDNFITVDATGGNVTLTLPAASTTFGAGVGIDYVFKRLDNSGNSVTIQRAGSDTIDGGTSFTLTAQYESKSLRAISSSVWALH